MCVADGTNKRVPNMSPFKKAIYSCLHWFFQKVLFFFPWFRWLPPLGLIAIVVHRTLLEEDNLHPPPLEEQVPIDPSTITYPHFRSDDGYGTDIENPTTAMEGAPFGRNCSVVPPEKRNPQADPSPQYLSARLLARKFNKEGKFADAFPQFNILAAAWIQTMVHDWIGHFDDMREGQEVTLDKGKQHGCPLHEFKFRKTLKRESDDEFNSFRTNWWDASVMYGQNAETVDKARTKEGGKMKVNPRFEGVLPQYPDDPTLFSTGDNKNSWLGVDMLKELFLREHNAIADAIAKEKPDWDDEKIFGATRLVIAALLAKIHTIDWTIELLKTYTLKVGMYSNWYGLPIALFGKKIGSLFPAWFKLSAKKKADNKGVPFCLTEEFTAVYRLHPLLPDYMKVGDEYFELEDMVGQKTAGALTRDPATGEEVAPGEANTVTREFWKSIISYPCGALTLQNYPTALRDLAPTTDEGVEIEDRIDLAAIDIYRDRERGIPKYNDFRRDLRMNPYRNFKHLTGNDKEMVKLLEEAYPGGIEDMDLMIGCMAEKKIPCFAISETSFTIFLLMASRRVDADPFLNEYYTEENYTKTGLDWVENTENLREVMERHYPDVMAELKLPKGKSLFAASLETPPPPPDKKAKYFGKGDGYGTFLRFSSI